MASKTRIAILISGRGSNMAALVKAASEPDFPAEIVGVLSDRPEAPGLELARQNRIETRAIPRSAHADKQAHEAAIDAALTGLKVDLVCLAGYMRLLSPAFVERWTGRMINIHPSLLPAFKGLATHRRALEAGLKIHGCTVHFVTADMDDGPIIAQAAVPVLAGDDEATLNARVLKAEHQLYPLALRLVAEGRVRQQAGRAVAHDLIEREPRTVLVAPDVDTVVEDLESLARFTP